LGKDTTVLFRKGEKYVHMSDGDMLYPVFIGGKFTKDGDQYTIQDIYGLNIKVAGKWSDKKDFEPCDITQVKSRKKFRVRNR
jgi:hypothetical protein